MAGALEADRFECMIDELEKATGGTYRPLSVSDKD